jgi:hypothetical protein
LIEPKEEFLEPICDWFKNLSGTDIANLFIAAFTALLFFLHLGEELHCLYRRLLDISQLR